VKLFIAQTIDGYIAGEGGSLDHLEPFAANDYGYNAHIASVDAVVVGRRAFDVVFPAHGWPYPPHLPGYVMTSRPLPPELPSHVVAATDPDEVAARHPDAYVDGGGHTIRRFLETGHLREARIFILPILLGRGVRLFPEGDAIDGRLELVTVRSFPCGTAELHYRIEAMTSPRT